MESLGFSHEQYRVGLSVAWSYKIMSKFCPSISEGKKGDKGVTVHFLRRLQWRQACCKMLQNYCRLLHECSEKFLSQQLLVSFQPYSVFVASSHFFTAEEWYCTFLASSGSRPQCLGFLCNPCGGTGGSDRERRCVSTSCPHVSGGDRCHLHHVPVQRDVASKATCAARTCLSTNMSLRRRLWTEQKSCVVVFEPHRIKVEG